MAAELLLGQGKKDLCHFEEARFVARHAGNTGRSIGKILLSGCFIGNDRADQMDQGVILRIVCQQDLHAMLLLRLEGKGKPFGGSGIAVPVPEDGCIGKDTCIHGYDLDGDGALIFEQGMAFIECVIWRQRHTPGQLQRLVGGKHRSPAKLQLAQGIERIRNIDSIHGERFSDLDRGKLRQKLLRQFKGKPVIGVGLPVVTRLQAGIGKLHIGKRIMLPLCGQGGGADGLLKAVNGFCGGVSGDEGQGRYSRQILAGQKIALYGQKVDCKGLSGGACGKRKQNTYEQAEAKKPGMAFHIRSSFQPV